MKFGENLHLHIYTPWDKYCVPYHRLKRMLSRYEAIRKQYLKECAEEKVEGNNKKDVDLKNNKNQEILYETSLHQHGNFDKDEKV